MFSTSIVLLVVLPCLVVSSSEASSDGPCSMINIVDAENNILKAFSVGFDRTKMSVDSKQMVYCLENKTEPLRLKQIPHCYKPRYCLLCRVAMYTLITSYKLKSATTATLKPSVTQVAEGLCQMAKFDKQYCQQLVSQYVEPIIEILHSNPQLTSNDVCTMAFAPIGCTEGYSDKLVPKAVKLTEPDSKSTVAAIPRKAVPLKILHLTDLHYDPLYVEGVESEEQVKQCTKTFACCRYGSTKKGMNETHWGNYQFCDTPRALLENSLQQISVRHSDVKLLYVTGDLVRHHFTEVDFDTLKKDTTFVFELLMNTFKGKPILFALGNHDSNVFGMFSSNQRPSASGQTEVYKFFQRWVTKLWNNGNLVLPHRNINWVARGEGYYTVRLTERLRLIVLNSNVPYIYNWWLLVDHFYGAQLQWLQDVLARAESQQQKVHILSHIPPNHISLASGWSQQYQRIVERYRNTIVAQFNGHSHLDEFTLFYDSGNMSAPISVAWNGGALTPHAYHNPNYHVVTVDANDYAVTALESYIFNLDEANKSPGKSPEWKLSFNMSEVYGLPDLSLNSLDGFVKRMTQDEALVEKYLRNKVKNGPRTKQALTAECKEAAICSILTTDSRYKAKCKSVVDIIGWSRNKNKFCLNDSY